MDPPSTGVFVESSLMEGSADVQLVLHDDEGDWQFLDISRDASGVPELACFHCVFNPYPDIEELADLPVGWQARQTADGWHRSLAAPLED